MLDNKTKKEMIRRLKKARKIIQTGEHWVQRKYAAKINEISNDFQMVNPDHPEAFAFCAIGSLEKVTSEIYNPTTILRDDIMMDLNLILSRNSHELFHGHTITSVNDSIGLDAVLTVFDYTIDQLSSANDV